MKSILKKILAFLFFLIKRRKRKPVSVNRIALISAGYLGDTFWALQTLPILRKSFPRAEIFVIGRSFCSVLARQEKVIVVNNIPSDRTRDSWSFRAMMRNAKKIRKEVVPDLVFDLTCNRYSALFAWKIGAYTVGADIAGEAAVLYQHSAPVKSRKCQHLVHQSLTILRSFLGLPELENTPPLIAPAPLYNKEETAEKLELDRDPILLVPGAGWNAKMWQKEKWQTLAKYCMEHGKTVLISGSKAEFELCKEIAQDLDRKQVRLMIDDLELIISLLPHLSCCIGSDSGISHLAAAAGVNTVQLFCPTNPIHSAALGKRVSILRSSCPLKPENNEKFCTGTPIMTCSRKECMDIPVERVIAEMERMSVL